MKKKLYVCLLAAAMCFALAGCSKDEGDKDKAQAPADDYGTVEQVTVFDIVDKFNVALSDDGQQYFANNDYMIAENGLYWYGLYDDITCYVKPVEFSEDMEKDIAKTVAIRYDAGSENEQMVKDYVKLLIKANNSSISEEEIDQLMTEAEEKAADGKTANNGKGITVGILITDEFTEYQVVRVYE